MPRRAVIAILGALAVALPSQAHAATLAAGGSCFLEGSTVTLKGTAFAPNGRVLLALGGRPYGSALADAAGALTALGGLPDLQRGTSQRVTITATDEANAANRAEVSFRITSLGVDVTPSRGSRPNRRATFRARGFRVGGTLWVHYVTPGGRSYKTVKLGKTASPCGTVTKKMRLIPSKRARAGRWGLRVDTHKRYSSRTRPQVRLSVRVRAKKS